jgi:ABC-2 type transport system ATP-binding protein
LDALVAEGVHHSYRRFPWSRGRPALSGVSLTVRTGELHLLAGPNGAGKSTLLKVLCGLLDPRSGSVAVFGRPPLDRGAARRIAWMPEAIDAESRLTAREAVELHAALYGFRGADRRARSDAALEQVGMAALARRPLRLLSKGEQRRVAFAQALVSDADLLLLDEPLDGVDPESSERLVELLSERCATGKSALLSTHVLLDGRRGHVLTVLEAGRVLASGPPDQLLPRGADGTPITFAELLRRARAGAASAAR